MSLIGHLHDPVTWYGINYTGTQITQWDFQNKETRTSPARLSFVLKVPLRNLRPSLIYSMPCDRIMQRAYFDISVVSMRRSGDRHVTKTAPRRGVCKAKVFPKLKKAFGGDRGERAYADYVAKSDKFVGKKKFAKETKILRLS